MESKSATYLSLTRSAWLALAIFLVIFCGPVKKLIELRLDNAGITTSQTSDKKLRTGYREKRDTAPLIHITSHQSPDAGLALFLATTLSFIFLSKSGIAFKLRPSPLSLVSGLPLYLDFRKLQI